MIKIVNTLGNIVFVNASQVLKVQHHKRYNCTVVIDINSSILVYTYTQPFELSRQLTEILNGVTP